MFLGLFTAIFALAIGLYIMPVAMKAARQLGMMAVPDGGLRVHGESVPYLGGIALYIAVLVSLAVAAEFNPVMLGLLLGCTTMLMVGLIDDFGVMTARIKLFGQVMAAVAMIKGGIMLELEIISALRWPADLPLLSWFLSVVWLVGLANAVNFLDIEDGLAAGVAACCCPALFAVAWLNQRMDAVVFTAALFGAALSFLRYNAPLPKAKIYLGDAGSLMLGLALAALAMSGSYTGQNDLAAVCPVIILGVPCFELGVTIAARLRKAAPPWHGSPDHVAKRLQRLGLSKRAVLAIHCAASLALGGMGIFIMNADIKSAIIAVAALGAVAVIAFFLLIRVEAAPPGKD